MGELVTIPMFPLTIFPLPGELVSLHIFEPRYQQLLKDAEEQGVTFGIYFNHTANIRKFGALVKLESVIKRYVGGESDVIVKGIGLFTMDKLYRTFGDKLYPGGDVEHFDDGKDSVLHQVKLIKVYQEYLDILEIHESKKDYSVYAIANQLQLELMDKLKLVSYNDVRRETFLLSRIQYEVMLLKQAEKSKDVFHLN
jgi:Lon protease-like protein